MNLDPKHQNETTKRNKQNDQNETTAENVDFTSDILSHLRLLNYYGRLTKLYVFSTTQAAKTKLDTLVFRTKHFSSFCSF